MKYFKFVLGVLPKKNYALKTDNQICSAMSDTLRHLLCCKRSKTLKQISIYSCSKFPEMTALFIFRGTQQRILLFSIPKQVSIQINPHFLIFFFLAALSFVPITHAHLLYPPPPLSSIQAKRDQPLSPTYTN